METEITKKDRFAFSWKMFRQLDKHLNNLNRSGLFELLASSCTIIPLAQELACCPLSDRIRAELWYRLWPLARCFSSLPMRLQKTSSGKMVLTIDYGLAGDVRELALMNLVFSEQDVENVIVGLEDFPEGILFSWRVRDELVRQGVRDMAAKAKGRLDRVYYSEDPKSGRINFSRAVEVRDA